jgi:23S rRNA (guanosine2251-2'-O)-methyltransferase
MNRDRELVYGRRPVAEARRGKRTVHAVHEAPEVPPEQLTRLASTEDHQGVVAEVDPFPYADGIEILDPADSPLILALDQVQDPRNLGAVCRSAEIAGVRAVVIPERRSASVTPVVCKTSAGAVEHLDVARVRNLADWLGQARDRGFWIYGAAVEDGLPPWEIDLAAPTVLVLGAEGKGLRPRVADSCDGFVTLPGAGRVESLNVSAAASALVFEALRQRAASDQVT